MQEARIAAERTNIVKSLFLLSAQDRAKLLHDLEARETGMLAHSNRRICLAASLANARKAKAPAAEIRRIAADLAAHNAAYPP